MLDLFMRYNETDRAIILFTIACGTATGVAFGSWIVQHFGLV